jgi:dihydrofolate synthase / folylpolyglutamate synthase
MLLNYQQTLNYLFEKLPMFQNIGKFALTKDLTNTIKLLEFIGNPHLHTKWIHIGGTNGKGSTSSMVAAALTANGYKTGLYTSPHLIDFRERIRVDGEMITEQFVIDFTNKIAPAIEAFSPSFFEITVAMAFEYFKVCKIDIGVIEVGLGGRLDSTNVITPIVSAITSIGLDHTDILGNTIEEIALEKAGIIKENNNYLIGEIPLNASVVIRNFGDSINANFIQNEPTPTLWENSASLKGSYQKSNINLAYNILLTLNRLNVPLVNESNLEGIANVNKYTGLRGRWEIINTLPLTICDTGHNYDGVEYIVEQLKSYNCEKMHIVWGMVKDKDATAILELLPKNAVYYVCKPSVIRGQESEVMTMLLSNKGFTAFDCQTAANAFKMANDNCKNNDLIFIGGSTFVVADFLNSI